MKKSATLLFLLSSILMVGCGQKGEQGKTPEVTINSDGYWCVDGVSTGVKAQGETGPKGEGFKPVDFSDYEN